MVLNTYSVCGDNSEFKCEYRQTRAWGHFYVQLGNQVTKLQARLY